jgi:hypothetical protein
MTDRSRAFDDVDGADPQAELDAYRGEIEQAKAAVRDLGLDDRVDGYSRYGVPSRNLRWIYVHMIEEYARHNGHADLLREHLDGVVGD